MDRNKIYRQIYGFAKELGIDKEELYAVLWRETQKDSMKLCTDTELRAVVDYLKLQKDTTDLGERGASAAQLKKIVALGYAMDWDKDDNGNYQKGLLDKRLNGLCEKQYKVSAYKWLDKEGAWAFIETLKKLKVKQSKQPKQPKQGECEPKAQAYKKTSNTQPRQQNKNKMAVSAT